VAVSSVPAVRREGPSVFIAAFGSGSLRWPAAARTLETQDCVSMCDVDESDDQPLGYLMYRVMAALRPQAVAALRPL